MSIWQDVALPKSLDDYLADRDTVRAKIADGYEALKEADRLMSANHRVGITGESRPKNSLDQALADVDRKFWRLAFDLTGFGQYMDAQARDQFETSLNKAEPPPFTRDNIIATFGDLLQSKDEMWRRGVTELFRTLQGHYKTNDAFKIGPKIIMENAAQIRFMGGREIRYGRDADRLNDLDRVLRTIDGEEHKPRALESAINEAFRDWQDYQDERIKARVYKNGNVHVWFMQPGHHVSRINQIIAEHYGETLADGR